MLDTYAHMHYNYNGAVCGKTFLIQFIIDSLQRIRFLKVNTQCAMCKEGLSDWMFDRDEALCRLPYA